METSHVVFGVVYFFLKERSMVKRILEEEKTVEEIKERIFLLFPFEELEKGRFNCMVYKIGWDKPMIEDCYQHNLRVPIDDKIRNDCNLLGIKIDIATIEKIFLDYRDRTEELMVVPSPYA